VKNLFYNLDNKWYGVHIVYEFGKILMICLLSGFSFCLKK